MKSILRCLLLVVPALWVNGCDYGNDNSRDHVPAKGMGALVVENNTTTDTRVYVDGESKGKVGDYDNKAFDLTPGVHRVVLDEVHGDRTFRDDVDIIDGRLSILDVAGGFSPSAYDVRIFFD